MIRGSAEQENEDLKYKEEKKAKVKAQDNVANVKQKRKNKKKIEQVNVANCCST
jgi:hypothetical protein